MKRAWIAGIVLAVMLMGAWGNAWFIQTFTDALSGLLEEAESYAKADNWEAAGRITQDAMDRWDRAAGYLYTVLPHADTDQVDAGFHQVLEWIESQDDGEYSSSNAALVAQIRLLAEMEALTLKNLL